MPQLPHLAPVYLVFFLSLTGAAAAQTPPAVDNLAATATVSPSGGPTDRRIEHIRIEDKGSRIDELRVGGETRSITVSPKGGMPAYEVLPSDSNQSLVAGPRNAPAASGGTRVWKILGF